MSTTTTTAAATATTACTNLYDSPNQDTTCAMPYTGNHTDIMKKCCGDAQIVSYHNDCGIYCVALDQTVSDLADCLYENGAPWEAVFCSVPKSVSSDVASKTKDAAVPASAQASVISGGDSDKDDDKDKDSDKDSDDKDSDDSDSTASGTASSASSTSTGNAAAGVVPQSSVSTLGLTIGALLFSSMALGAFNI
ncbi:hypothetical protein NW754_005812 [Fusarium falciforme]|uniref:Uncharacterized protein n=1 Tax=Fusarium falciforme TaxID=195108 RepID=A0A9W8UX04_9HYPO|nr:Hypothetical protein NCS54_00622300 [Fusarium falciforme]KAJ4169660.1 hypothetical protein NW754_005812 [Fusarium falciforme]KAJ4180200.1 hypothetical protein NW755_011888 [Fusarium falciforme]KAJ4199031.1 hypothetical protein NW767_008614 [Fusarium falciforme]KAJ4240336.1 hypothetical protein NW757_012514 [Fusarium falciforme]WAO88860.1 Hypothetical protein NCS54_00622300 [Fusarium falciforme]